LEVVPTEVTDHLTLEPPGGSLIRADLFADTGDSKHYPVGNISLAMLKMVFYAVQRLSTLNMAEAEWENQMDNYEPEGSDFDPNDDDDVPYYWREPCWTVNSSLFAITTIALRPGSKKLDLF